MKFVTCTILLFMNFLVAYSQGALKLARQYSSVKRDQFIEFSHLGDLQFEAGRISYSLKAVSSCGLPIEYKSYDTSIAEISNSRVIIKKPGRVRISAFQEGNNYFNSTEASREILSSPLPQTIDIGEVQDVSLDKGEISLTARCTSQLPIEFSTQSPCVKIIGDKIILLKEGEVLLEATQSGNGLFLPALASVKFNVLSCSDK